MNFFVVFLGAVGTTAIFLNPFLGLMLTIALIPQALIPAFGAGLGVFTAATPIKLIGGLTFIAVFFNNRVKNKRVRFFNRHSTRFYFFFLLWVFISGFTRPGSFTRENFTMFISFSMLGFIIISLIDSESRLRRIIWVGIISVSIASLSAIIEYAGYQQMARISGTAYGPNYFAIGLLPFLGMSFANIAVEKKILLKHLSIASTLIIIAGLIVTFSRSGLIGFFAMILTVVLKSKKKIKAVIIGLVCILILISILPSYVWERFQMTKLDGPRDDRTVQSTLTRYYLIKAAWEMFLANPVLGVGVGNFYWECRNYEPVGPRRAHTTYLEVLAELGIIGLILFIGILFFSLKTLNKIITENTALGNYAYGLYIGLVGFLVAALFLHAQQEKVLWVTVFMSVALENIWVKNNEPSSKKIKKHKYN